MSANSFVQKELSYFFCFLRKFIDKNNTKMYINLLLLLLTSC